MSVQTPKSGDIDFLQREDETTSMTSTDAVAPEVKIYYVKTDWLPQFVTRVLPNLEAPIKLVSGSSDYTPQHVFPSETRAILKSPLIISWWATNNDIVHPKVHSLPYGLAHCSGIREEGWERRVREALLLALSKGRKKQEETKFKILCRWRDRPGNDAGADKVERPRAMSWARKNIDLCDIVENEVPPMEHFRLTCTYDFVLCPNGNGIDPSPRAWEALILKSVPIIKSSTMNDAYSRLPCLIVDDWSDVTLELLRTKGNELRTKLWESRDLMHVLSMDYWEDLIRSEQS